MFDKPTHTYQTEQTVSYNRNEGALVPSSTPKIQRFPSPDMEQKNL